MSDWARPEPDKDYPNYQIKKLVLDKVKVYGIIYLQSDKGVKEMPSLRKAKDRDRKRKKARHGMRVDSKSVLLIERLQRERAEKIKREKEKKND